MYTTVVFQAEILKLKINGKTIGIYSGMSARIHTRILKASVGPDRAG